MPISEGTMVEGVHCVPNLVELMPKQHDIPKSMAAYSGTTKYLHIHYLDFRILFISDCQSFDLTSNYVHKGRNHEVRELVKNAGLEVDSLKRVRIGGFRLPSDLG
ncbi:unnamed protein product [Arabidopsis thaliana]|uniref:(thale cress) hypothetical protein n=1 Tax=Arabidopsis thaliana TaxID=3702 RepID=A0A7G2EPZ7_ARATH|nr:unnamed protein product [Arabidopsis thaliana]